MNKDIINPSKKTITYAATLSSVVSLLPVEEPDVPYLNRSNGIVSITTTPRKGQWAYGKIPRLFLLYAQTLIKEVSPMVDFENRTIHLDETFNSFCKNTGIAANGQREQVTRMLENLGSTVFQVTNWFKDEQGRTVHDAINVLVADRTHICFDRNSDEYKEGSYIRFSELMWGILNENPVPLNREIVMNLGKSSRALDIYQWLARRTYYISKPVLIPWNGLQMQFDASNTPLRRFKERFKKALEMVRQNWPELHVEAVDEGLKVYPCRKSLESKQRAIGGVPMLESPTQPTKTSSKPDGNPF